MNPYTYTLIWTDKGGSFYTLASVTGKTVLMDKREAEETTDKGIIQAHQVREMVPGDRYWIHVKNLENFFGVTV